MRAAPGTVVVAVVAAAVLALGLPAAASSEAAANTTPPLHAIVLSAIGPGYGITAQGPLDSASFASNAPDPAAASSALATLGRTVDDYQRVWLDGSRTNAVQDMVVRFSSPAAAEIFLRAAQRSLDKGEIVSSGSLPSVPDARRTTYFGSISEPGVGEAISMRAGVYVAILSFFSAASSNPQPISPADAARVAKAQQAALVAAPGGTDSSARGVTPSSLGWAALAVAVLAAAVATPLLLRRRRDHERAST